ncbi:MAG: site-specific integrase [Candidatus Microthrix parvicella]
MRKNRSIFPLPAGSPGLECHNRIPILARARPNWADTNGDPLSWLCRRRHKHGLRHTWATLALQEGIDIKIVSDRLNHSSTHITREIYTHVTPPMQSDAADRVASQIFGS